MKSRKGKTWRQKVLLLLLCFYVSFLPCYQREWANAAAAVAVAAVVAVAAGAAIVAVAAVVAIAAA